MRMNSYRTLELIETAKKKISIGCSEGEMTFEEWNKINNHLDNAYIGLMRILNNRATKERLEDEII
ncbi:hypothetical protein SALINJAH_286 [Bacillus phage SalinJah]|uniref:Uncharacterized protein n=1 Tax=Bacillus phage SalinJah TaxID=1837830 RepID=A0A173GBR6_9CAUD|nr:hypothetical protein [Bacillus thuringiensis]YP_009282240.1 hypothetical protein SALINJAH_286 [Bacillus phage SalinJah]ANH50643.1 hypothetical protein SALINJAH_286 [Bacillus phage SalinJah]OTZ47939.1 hypothetical protein BK762_19845 [Bacillus thuringiensis serovar toumanoffi]